MASLLTYHYARLGLQSFVKASVDQIGPQSDSAPIMGRDTKESNSTMNEVRGESTVINATGDDRLYTYDSQANAKGNTTSMSVFQ